MRSQTPDLLQHKSGQPVLHRLFVTFGPLDENPLLGTQLGALVVAMGRAHPNPGETRAQGEVGAFTPFDSLPLRGLQLKCQLLDRLWALLCSVAPT